MKTSIPVGEPQGDMTVTVEAWNAKRHEITRLVLDMSRLSLHVGRLEGILDALLAISGCHETDECECHGTSGCEHRTCALLRRYVELKKEGK